MENYRTGHSCGRPYNRTCGMNRSQPMNKTVTKSGYSSKDTDSCNCIMPEMQRKNSEMFSHLQYLEPTMAYIPCQKFTENFPLQYALNVETIFPQLYKPFCGKRGARR